MTTAPPAPIDPADAPLPDTRPLRRMEAAARTGAAQRGSAPLVGYLVLVPEGTDPADLFVQGVTRPEIRRVDRTEPAPERQPTAPAVRVDPERQVAELDGHELDLTYLEFGLLVHLVRHPHQVHSRERLMAAIWGYDHVGDGRTVDVHIARLRRKLGRTHRHRIVTVRRVGYKYVPDR